MITNITLSTKEQMLLQDQKTHEEQCIMKYQNYANLASSNQLKSVFNNLLQKEEEHLQTINQLLNGQVPSMGGQSGSQGGSQNSSQSMGQSQQQSQGSQGSSQSMSMSQQSQSSQSSSGQFKASDKEMCIDMLNTEKYVSHAYDIAIFEFQNPQVRDVLNHIQKEEQKHGEAIFSYMQSNGMYSVQ